jgi:hypothetical protein
MSRAIVIEALLYVFRRRLSELMRRSAYEPGNVAGDDQPAEGTNEG